MRKLAIFSLAAFAVAILISAFPLSAATMNLVVNANKAGDTWGNMCQNAEVNGGEGTDIMYNYMVNGHIESSHRSAAPHPYQLGGGGTGDDTGVAFRTNLSCGTSWDTLLCGDSVNMADGDTLVSVSAFTTDPLTIIDSAGAPLTRAGFMALTGWQGHMSVFSGVLAGGGMTWNQNAGAASNPGVSELQLGTYDQTASLRVTNGTNPTSLQMNWAHIEWAADPIPVFNSDPAVNSLGAAAVLGFQVFRSDVDPAGSVPSDYSGGGGLDWINPTSPVLSDGTAVPAGGGGNHSGLSGGGNLYFNDGTTMLAGTNYAVTPMMAVGGTWGAEGVPMYMEGTSWYPLSGAGGLTSGFTQANAPTDTQIASFTAELNQRGDKVTLNWRTGSEADIIGFNIVRKFKLNGRDRGRSVRVNRNMIAATGVDGSDYSFVDSIRLPSQSKRARSVSIVYEIEIVDASGNSSLVGTTDVSLASARTR